MQLTPSNRELTTLNRHESALVVGLGVSGYSAVRYLLARGLLVRVWDAHPIPKLAAKLKEEFPDVATSFGGAELSVKETLLVVSPGVPLTSPLVKLALEQGAEVVGDIELFIQENQLPVIAITGSNGKSTVTTLVGEMCVAGDITPLVAGNIGAPVLDALSFQKHYDVAVLELSSFQLETTKQLKADCATILNISADHMDRYDSMGDYILAKARVLRGAKHAVLPLHDSGLEQIIKVNATSHFSLEAPENNLQYGVKRISKRRWLSHGENLLMPLRDVPLVGLHNIKNVLSAFALVEFLKIPADALVAAVKSFKGLPHRMQTIAEQNQVRWVNDSKATNVGATQTALQNIEGEVVWIAGGQSKGADFSDLQSSISSNIRALISFGQDSDELNAALAGMLDIYPVADLTAAVKKAGELAKTACTVLFSPACASFDMFRDFEHRGSSFAELVQQHIAGANS